MIKKTGIVLLAFVLLSIDLNTDGYSVAELMGKGSITFYGDDYKLQKEAHNAFLLMQKEALKSNIHIQVVSSYRSFDHQKSIWNRKYKRYTQQGLKPTNAIKKIIEYSTIPGTSRHHWGTDIDIIDSRVVQPKSVLEVMHFEGEGVYVNLKKWMDVHAGDFGFCLVYTDDINRKGFKYEPWHYSYKPISIKMLQQYQELDIKTLLKKEKLLGSVHFTEEFMNSYITNNIMDINPDLK